MKCAASSARLQHQEHGAGERKDAAHEQVAQLRRRVQSVGRWRSAPRYSHRYHDSDHADAGHGFQQGRASLAI